MPLGVVKAALRCMPRLQAEESIRTVQAIHVALGGGKDQWAAWVAQVQEQARSVIDQAVRDEQIRAAGLRVFGPKATDAHG